MRNICKTGCRLLLVFIIFCANAKAGAGGAKTSVDLWQIPEAAWHRPIGDYPKGASGTVVPLEALTLPQTRTKRGIPVGGIGTGSFMFNLAGSFGPWEMDIGGDDSFLSRWGSELNSGHEERFLKQAAFHVFEKAGSQIFVKTLATEDVLPAWPRLARGQGDYFALFPKAWFAYRGFPAPVAMEQFSPFVARDERLSSLPLGIFQFAVYNPTDSPIETAVMFTFPNAIYRSNTVSYQYPRKGLRSKAERLGDVLCVRLQAESPRNVPETQRTEWVIAVRDPGNATLSYTQDWASDRSGADIISDFSDDGVLSDKPLDARGKGLAGAVAVKVKLAPGERRVLQFALAWDFPVVQFKNPKNGTRWEKRYKEWYPGDFRGADIARDALANADKIEAAIDGWWKKVADEPAYPLWLRQAALNELYYDLFGGVFWENRCLSKPKKFGARPGQHLYFSHEAAVYRDAETLDVRHYEARHMLVLFPTIERDVLLGWADFIMDDPLGRTPHDAGSPMNDPWFVYGQYSSTSPGLKPPSMHWKDLPSRFVQEAHAYWKYTGDDKFLREVYPAAKKTLAYLATFDKNGNGLPESTGADTSYDALSLKGASTYVAGLYIGALEAMNEMALATGETADARLYAALAAKARAQAEAVLWVEDEGYYKLDVKGPFSRALMADALNGQRYAEVNGLPDVLDRGRMARHLEKVYQQNVLGFENGRYGAVNVVAEHGGNISNLMAQGVWPGGSYYTAAVMYHAGKVLGRPDLMDAALATAKGAYQCTYQDESMAFWFDTPAIWYPKQPTMFRSQQNMRPRAVWELLLEIKDPFDKPGKK
jgi:non-lysosomal glucosylceramidase